MAMKAFKLPDGHKNRISRAASKFLAWGWIDSKARPVLSRRRMGWV
jgi:hypothetical protein